MGYLEQFGDSPQAPTGIKVGMIEKAQPTYFFEQPKTKEIIACQSYEARNHWKDGWIQVGWSDGTTYQNAAKQAQEVYRKELLAFKAKNPGVIIPPEVKDEAFIVAQEILKQGYEAELIVAKTNLATHGGKEPPDNDVFGTPEAKRLMQK